MKDYTEAIRIDPNFAEAYINRGTVNREQSQFAPALKDFNEAIRINPDLFHGYKGLALIHAACPDAKFRDGKMAIALALKACQLTEWEARACIEVLAAGYAEAGDWVNAIKYQKQSVDMLEDGKLKQEQRDRLELYRQQKPYRHQEK